MPEIATVLPKYLQIANHLREQILRGDLIPGAELPSERQLATDWQVSRPTATKAMQVLSQQGLVEARQGAGTFVRDVHGTRRASHRYHRYRDRGAQYGQDERMEILAAEIVDAPPQVASALRLQPTQRALMRRRLVTQEGHGPTEVAISWWPAEIAEIAPRLLRYESLGGIGSVRYVESVTGRKASYAVDQVSARLATEQEIRELGLDTGQAVLTYRHTVYDTKDQPLEFAEAVYPPDVWTFEQEYPIEG